MVLAVCGAIGLAQCGGGSSSLQSLSTGARAILTEIRSTTRGTSEATRLLERADRLSSLGRVRLRRN
jgi:hypothetical protein